MMNDTYLDQSLHSQTLAFDEIPMVDIGPLVDGTDPESVAREIGRVCEHVGFLYIKNHGIDQSLIDQAYEQAQRFFALPQDQKDALHVEHSGQTLRGYIPPYFENVNPTVTRDVKEVFDYGAESDVVAPFQGPNLMPDDLDGFQDICEQYHTAMLALARKLIRAIAISLDLPEDYFETLQKNPITIQRFLHYPSQSGRINEQEIGIGAHTDYGFLTILAQDEIGGLQVLNAAGEWISAPPIDGTFIVNIGDLVQIFTNDRYRSTTHRVVNTSGRQRFSLPFFIDLDFDAVVDVVPTCRSDDHPAKYKPYTCGQHKFKRFTDSHEHLKQAS